MRIRNWNEATDRLHNDDYMPEDYSVVFDEKDHDGFNVGNIREDVAERMARADRFPLIEEHIPDDVPAEPPTQRPSSTSSGGGASSETNDSDSDTTESDD